MGLDLGQTRHYTAMASAVTQNRPFVVTSKPAIK
jgi:hypothetical protein